MTRILQYISLLSLLLLFGCRRDSYVEEACTAIGFAPAVTVETKTGSAKPNDPTVLITAGNRISVFGQRIVNEGGVGGQESISSVFTNQALECEWVDTETLNNSTWKYTPLQYWEDTGHYYFQGIFPYHASNYTLGNDWYINILYRAGDNNDLMVARGYRDVAANGKNPVPMAFNHACSAVRFLFGKESTSATANEFTLTDFRLENISVSGTLRLSTRRNTNPIETNYDNWIPGSLGTLFSWTADRPQDRKNIPHPSTTHDPDGYLQMGWYYMVPHTLNASASVRFSISYSGQAPMTTELNISSRAESPSGTVDSWVPNQVYNYFITITQSGLDLTVVTTPWDEVDVNTDEMVFMP